MTSMSRPSVSKTNTSTKQMKSTKAQDKSKDSTADNSNTGSGTSGSAKATSTKSSIENTQSKSKLPEIADPKVPSEKAEGWSGVYVNRFGEHLAVVVQEHPLYGIPIQEDGREIVLPTRSCLIETCRNFERGFCNRGTRCNRIHRLNLLSEVNKNIPWDIFRSGPLEVARTSAEINEVCKSFLDGRCPFKATCPRIHLIPPYHPLDSPPRCAFTVKLPPAPSSMKALSSSTTCLDILSDEQPFMVNLGSHPSLESLRISELAEIERWGCKTEASAWLDNDSDNSETTNSMDSSIHSLEPFIPVKHPPPRNSEVCRQWLRGICERGYDCWYVHGDLEYDKSISPQEFRPPAPSFYMATVHDHMRVKFGAGFRVQEVITGFETPWLYLSNIPPNVPHNDILHLLSKHGTVQDFRMDASGQRGTLGVRARFSSDIEARNANIVLNGTRQWDSIISTQLPVNTAHGRGATIQDTAVRIEWEAPSIVGYAGYSTEAQAKNAIAIAKASYSKTYISAHMYSGLPQMAAYTVRFCNLPIRTTKEQMSKYSKPLDMMWNMPNYTSVDEVVTFLRRKLESNSLEIISFDILTPPYRDGRVRAWVYFPTPAAAKTACQLLHFRKPMCTGRTRISAYHMQSLSYSIPNDQYTQIQEDIANFRERLHREVQGSTFTISFSAKTVTIRLSTVDGKDLKYLKAEFEQLRGGEVVKHNGEVLWDRLFSLPAGKAYLRNLETTHPGIAIRDNPSRRRLTLFGDPGLRDTIKAVLIQKHSELQVRQKRSFILGPLIGPFMHFEFPSLSKTLGPEKLVLDLWKRELVVSGRNHDFRIALQAVQRIQRKQNPRLLQHGVASCPVCLGEVDCPVTLSQCKHVYCRACLISYLQAAIGNKFFPLTCLGDENNCTSPLQISVTRQVLSAGEFDSLAEAAFEAYIHERPDEFHYCPSPDCMQVYRPAPSGNTLQCPSCLLRICPQCHVEQHDGFDCPDRDGGDHLFNEWIKTHNVKNCPSCKVPIERAEGCNHVTCIRCRTHICWVCMQTFPGGDGIYNHMRAEHGGIGNAFDDDGL
ncbi:hypothetical protein F5050DRAFT_1734758 [Lentinula boryana]|uniref:RING-type E3 ubiquitin transferase n=1 Tax=Lentinula boryana TaxID=40481 RepID=A0ABQ8QMK8_9AGAR|nr:hypothetical protein F5050DRAFT_1734758 [Lentinula boryana]